MTGLPVPVPVVEERRPADAEVATAVAPPVGEGTLGDREVGARGMARGRVSMMFVPFRCPGRGFLLKNPNGGLVGRNR